MKPLAFVVILFAVGLVLAQAPPVEPGPPRKDPPGPAQTSWPQVDFGDPRSVGAFVDSGRWGVLSDDGARKPAATYYGWLSVGAVCFEEATGRRLLKVLSDRWTAGDYSPNPDAKMPDDKGWAWGLDLDTMRVCRLKCDVLVRPAASARLVVEPGR